MVLVFSAKDLENNVYEIRVTTVYVCIDCKTTRAKMLYPLNTTGLQSTDVGVPSHIQLDNIPPANHEILTHLVPGFKSLVVPKGTFDQILKVCVGGF